MNGTRNFAISLGVVVLIIGSPNSARAAALPTGPSKILCNEAPKGSVLPIPILVSDWVAIICVDSGQAIAPEIKKYHAIWITTKDARPFVLTAAPAGWERPDSLSRYQIRFASLVATERTGDARETTLKMWERAFGTVTRPAIERVVQLDAQSVVNGTMYNLFFYTIGDRPRWIIICRDACQTSVPLTVQDLAEKTN
jgi:hypothetical protein